MPVPKRRHSTRRKGKRLAQRKVGFGALVACGNCGKMKRPHRVCKYCDK